MSGSICPKFNVGDKVKVIKQGCKLSNKIVEIVRIKEELPFGYSYDVKTYGGNERSTYAECSLEYCMILPQKVEPLEIGDRVELHHMTKGLMRGTVKRKMGQHFEVLFDDGTVDNCPQSRLTLIVGEEREENNMTKLTGFKRIAVIEVGYKNYDYALYDDTVEEGDTVIVTGAASDKILEVNKVIEVTDDLNVDHITAEVRGKVDLTAYNKRVEKRQRKADLIKKMDKAIAEANELDKYTKYAEFLGDDFKAMLDEFKSL